MPASSIGERATRASGQLAERRARPASASALPKRRGEAPSSARARRTPMTRGGHLRRPAPPLRPELELPTPVAHSAVARTIAALARDGPALPHARPKAVHQRTAGSAPPRGNGAASLQPLRASADVKPQRRAGCRRHRATRAFTGGAACAACASGHMRGSRSRVQPADPALGRAWASSARCANAMRAPDWCRRPPRSPADADARVRSIDRRGDHRQLRVAGHVRV